MDKKYFAVRKGDSTGVFFETYTEVLKRKPKEFKSFKNEKDAKAYLNSEGEEKAQNVCEDIDMSNADAIIYSDGSLNFEFEKIKDLSPEELYASYGLVILFRKTNKVYYESGKLLDGNEERTRKDGLTERNFYVWRYGKNGERVDKLMKPAAIDSEPEEYWYQDVFKEKKSFSEEEKDRKHGFVLASGSDAGEMEGVRRGLEICFGEKDLKEVVIVYDLEIAVNLFNGGHDEKKNEPVFFVKQLEKYRTADIPKVHFAKIKSHKSSENVIHGAFNDCADILAKAETKNKPIGNKIKTDGTKGKNENPNLEKLLGYKIVSKVAENDIEARRKDTRALVEEAIRLAQNIK